MSIIDHPGARFVTPATPGRRHYAPAVDKIARALYRSPLMPWQRHVARIETETLEDDSWAYRIIVVTVPRQAGKTTLRGPLILHRCIIRPYGRCWFTAQTRQDARDIVIDEVGSRFTRSPLHSLAKVRRSQGSEGIYFEPSTGASYRIFPPKEGGLDGKANERVDVDEPWRIDPLTGAALDNSILPTFTTTGGQFGMTSTAGTAKSTWLLGYVLQGRAAVKAGDRTGIALIEFGVPDDVADHIRDLLGHGPRGRRFDEAVQLLQRHNPADGYTLRGDALAAGVKGMMANPELGGIDGVLRAYGNHWTRGALTLIPSAVFAECAAGDVPPTPATAAVGVAAGIDRTDAAIVYAWRDETGRPYWRVHDHRPGVSWAPPALATARRARAAGCSAAGPVLDLVDTAERHHKAGAITRFSERDYATACGQALGLILERIVHIDDATGAMAAAAGDAAKRRIGDGGWAWDRTGATGSIATLEAATVALWAWDHRATYPTPDAR